MNNKLDVTQTILNYKNFLLASKFSVDKLLVNHDWHDDSEAYPNWVQANWELLVELMLVNENEYLGTISFFEKGERYRTKSLNATYWIICESHEISAKFDEDDVLVFRCYLGYYKGLSGILDPYDLILVFSIKDDRFYELHFEGT